MERYYFLLNDGTVSSEYAGTTCMSRNQFSEITHICGKKVVDRCHYISWVNAPNPEWLKSHFEKENRLSAIAFVREARHNLTQTPKNLYYPEYFAEAAEYLGVEKAYAEALRRFTPGAAFELVTRHIEI